MAELLTIGEVARRSGVAASALRFYEERGLIASERAGSGHRRYPRAVLRRIAFIVFAQRIGLTLDEIGAELAKLPPDRAPTRRDWSRLSSGWTRADRRPDRRARAPAGRASPSASAAAACRSTAASSPTRRPRRRASARARATGSATGPRAGSMPLRAHPGLDARDHRLHHLHPRVALALGLHQLPPRRLVVGARQHVLHRLEVLRPLLAVLPVVRRQLPASSADRLALLEAPQLLLLGDVQPELDQDHRPRRRAMRSSPTISS